MFTDESARAIKKIDLDVRIEEAVRASNHHTSATIRVRRENDGDLYRTIEKELDVRGFKTYVPENHDICFGGVRDVYFWWDE